jgi:CubicO group peptidase (beta-lactamase class C family)
MRTLPLPFRLRAAVGCVAFLGLVVPLLASPQTVGNDQLGAAVRARMQAFVDEGEIAGAVTVIGRKDAVLSYEAIGSQDLEARRPMAKDALFRIASMTKPVTALGIMMLADEGKLSVEDPVEKHLPEFRGQMLVAARSQAGDVVALKKPPRSITLRDLLTHTSGLPGGFPPGLADLYVKRNRTLAEGILAMSQQPLTFEPGSKWAYCNAGIDTLGRVIEVLSGQSYEDFLSQRIFRPLGMTDTTFYPTPAQLERLATTYGKTDGKLTPTPNTIIALSAGAKYPVPAGGLYSTGADLAKLYQMMLRRGTQGNVRYVSDANITAMTKVQTGDLTCGFVPGMGFGFGWGVVRQPQGVTEKLSAGSYGHGGAFGTQGWIDPQQDLFVVLLIQRTGLQNSDASPMRKELQALAAAAVRR